MKINTVMYKRSINRKSLKLLFVIIAIFTLTLSPYTLSAEGQKNKVHFYIKKYRNIKPNKQMIRSVHKYKKYINYFCAFSYYRESHNINPNYIRALICTESGGKPKAVSEDDAYGLTQILLPTGKRWGRELYKRKYDFKYIDDDKLKNITKEDLFDPAINILLACYGTDKFNYMFGGKNMIQIAASWNAGHKVVLKNETAIPYKETMQFVGKMNGYMTYFRKKNYSTYVPIKKLQ